MDLADELLNDLEEDFQDEGEAQEMEAALSAPVPEFKLPGLASTSNGRGKRKASEDPDEDEDADGQQDNTVLVDLPEGGVRPQEELDADQVEEMDLKAIADVNKVAKLSTNKTFQEALEVSLHPEQFSRILH